jgi:hypothetical protein
MKKRQSAEYPDRMLWRLRFSYTRLLLFAATGAALLACDKPAPGPALDLQVADLRAEPHWVATIETTLQYLDVDEESMTTTVAFEKPDLWSINEPWRAIPTETVVIADRAWQVQRREAVRIDPEPVRATTLSFVEAIAALDGSDWGTLIGDGPSLNGEPTLMVRFEQPNLGEIMNTAFDNAPESALIPVDQAAEIHEVQRDTSAAYTLLIGKSSHRVHFLRFTIEGPNQHANVDYRFDYSAPVFIEPPV